MSEENHSHRNLLKNFCEKVECHRSEFGEVRWIIYYDFAIASLFCLHRTNKRGVGWSWRLSFLFQPACIKDSTMVYHVYGSAIDFQVSLHEGEVKIVQEMLDWIPDMIHDMAGDNSNLRNRAAANTLHQVCICIWIRISFQLDAQSFLSAYQRWVSCPIRVIRITWLVEIVQ